MKTLSQIEARTPVQSLAAAAPYTITQPGSYYLTGNITVGIGNAIVINSDDVSLDLNGFTIRSSFIGGHNGAAITVTVDHARLSVRNGSILSGTSVPASGAPINAGFAYGIGSGAVISESSVTDVTISGVNSATLLLETGRVERCTVSNCSNFGIFASIVSHSSASRCIGKAISAGDDVSHCSGSSTASIGIECFGNVSNSRGVSSADYGIRCLGNATNSSGISTVGVGLSCDGNTAGCTGVSKIQYGLYCKLNATNCSGSSDNNGLYCLGNASDSSGFSKNQFGLYCGNNVTNCCGTSVGGDGLHCLGNASNSSGFSNAQRGLYCGKNVTNCSGTSTSGGGLHCLGSVSNSSGTSASGFGRQRCQFHRQERHWERRPGCHGHRQFLPWHPSGRTGHRR